jgi:transportin-3
LARYGSRYLVAERAGSILRRGLAFFPARALEPILEAVLTRMITSFAETGFASYLWIIGKIAMKFGDSARGPEGARIAELLGMSFAKITEEMQKILSGKSALEMPDGESSRLCISCTPDKQ